MTHIALIEQDVQYGRRGVRCGCPVARAIGRILPRSDPHVDYRFITWLQDGKRHNMPTTPDLQLWIELFDGHTEDNFWWFIENLPEFDLAPSPLP